MLTRIAWGMLLLVSIANGQVGWYPVASGTTATLNDVVMTSTTTAIAVGNDVTVLHSTDGGSSWLPQTAPFAAHFRAVAFANPQLGVAAGDGGAIMRTTNGGAQWDSVQFGWISNYNAAYYRKPNGLFSAVAGVNTIFQPLVTMSTNQWGSTGGEVFYINHDSSGNEGAVTDLTEPTPSVEIATCAVWDGHGAIVLQDGSHNWSTVYWANAILYAVDFPTHQIGYAVGQSGQVVKSTDGGLTWQQLPWTLRVDWYDVKFFNAAIGWVGGENGSIYRTDDGGETWEAQQSMGQGFIRALDFADSLHGVAVGDDGRIYRTTNGGLPNQPPTPFARLAPDDGSLDPFSTLPHVHFQWQTARDPEGQPIEYNFILRTDDLDIVDTFLTDTTLDYAIPLPVLDDLIPHYWVVVATDGARERQCSNGWGNFMITYEDADEPEGILPRELTLSNYPNPFNPQTTISFSLPKTGAASLRVFDITGRTVFEKNLGILSQGPHNVGFDGGELPSGIYIARLQTLNAQRSVKMTLLK